MRSSYIGYALSIVLFDLILLFLAVGLCYANKHGINTDSIATAVTTTKNADWLKK